MLPDPSGLFGLSCELRVQPKIRRLLSLALVIISSEDSYLLLLISKLTTQVHQHHFEVCFLGIFLFVLCCLL